MIASSSVGFSNAFNADPVITGISSPGKSYSLNNSLTSISTNSNNSSDSTGSNNSNNASNSAASNNQTNGKSQNASSANNASDAMFNKMVSDTIKEHGYSSSYGPDNFTLIDGGNGQYSLAEKSTGTIVGHYSVKNGELYKQDILTGNDVKVK